MTPDLFSSPSFPETRKAALQQLAAFVPRAGRYARDRNKLVPGHTNVSRLSPAIRHGLIRPEECVAATLERYAPSTVEKFTQEIYWRAYWKSWLSMRPQVWAGYLAELAAQTDEDREKAARLEAGEGDVEIMNHFARELVETGYLHNHARMWFAAWWVHVERLPWQLGADFFFRHLLDGDPASNTLSWRWVAGLQTPGKTYLPRRGNLERYIDPEILEAHRGGLKHLEHPEAWLPEVPPRPEITRRELPEEKADDELPTGVWIHEEDLLPESGPLEAWKESPAIVTADTESWERFGYAPHRQAWLRAALEDARARAAGHFRSAASGPKSALLPWAREQGLRQIVSLRPDVGPLDDAIEALRNSLGEEGIRLVLLDRPETLELRGLATAGFFGFWKKVQKAGVAERLT